MYILDVNLKIIVYAADINAKNNSLFRYMHMKRKKIVIILINVCVHAFKKKKKGEKKDE